MIRLGTSGRARGLELVERSPLRRADPRTKLALSLCASLAVMLPLPKLAAFLGLYALLLLWARLLPVAARQVWRLKWILLILFVGDWLLVDLNLAAVITLRLILLSGTFALFFATTTPAEMRLALEWMRVPHRYAFSVGLAFQSVGLLDDEWRTIREAQHARGAWSQPKKWRELPERVRDLVALSVPAVVLATKRAWAMTEAAYARGFDSPHRRPYRQLTLGRLDGLLLGATAAVAAILIVWVTMSQRVRIAILAGALVVLAAVVLGVEALRRSSATPELVPGSIPIYVEGELVGGFVPDDLDDLETARFVDAEEGKSQEGWMLRDVLRLYVPKRKLQPEARIVVASTSRGKSVELTWAEVDDPANWVLFDLSGRGTLKLVSVLERLDVRDEWVQDVDRIEIGGGQ